MKVSSPCPVTWESLPGTDRVRFCGQCRLNVYNLAILTPKEVEALVRKTKGRLCGQLYVRNDRTATLRDCPRGTLRKKIRRAWTAAAVLLLAGLGWALKSAGDRDRSVHPQWVQAVLEWVAPEPVRTYKVLGEICPVLPPQTTPN